MNYLSLILIASMSSLPLINSAAATAQARTYCRSLFLYRGTSVDDYQMDFTTLSSGVNNELALNWTGSRWTNFAFVVVNDLIFDIDYEGTLGVDIPAGTDANNNGYPDFFEISLAVNAVSSGTYSIPGLGFGTVTAQWSRDPSNTTGGVQFTLQNLTTFAHFFETLDFTGPLTYTPGSTVVTGSVNFTRTGTPDWKMLGPVQFQKVTTNKFNMLVLQGSDYWTNQFDYTLDLYLNRLYTRDLARPTNYWGDLEFFDGDPITFDIDYDRWRMVITDTNDSDGDGIPDFSDDLSSGLPRRPSLSLVRTSTNLLLRISGDVGRLHQVQEATSLPSVSWPVIASVTLTNDPQTVALPLPAGSPRFWRVTAQ